MPEDTHTVTYDAKDIENAINEAVHFLPKHFTPRHEHSKRCYRVLQHILYDDEYTVLEAKQSLVKSLSPIRIVATNKRIILVNPSFSSLWLGYNLFTPTRYEVIPYSNVANITLLTGISFSSISVFLTTGSPNWDGSIEGLKTKDAKAMFIFMEKVTESLRKQGNNPAPAAHKSSKKKRNEVDIKRSKEMVKNRGAKFVWLGPQPLDYVSDALEVDKNSVTRVDMGEIEKLDKGTAEKFDGCIFVCNNGAFSSSVSDYMWEKHGVNTFVLHGGIEQYKTAGKNTGTS